MAAWSHGQHAGGPCVQEGPAQRIHLGSGAPVKQALTDMILILCCFAHMCHDSWMRLAAKDGEMRGDPSVFPALVAKSWKR